MASRAGTYNLVNDFGVGSDSEYLSQNPYWIIAVIRLGKPLSYSRVSKGSIDTPITEAVSLRAEPLLITDDCISMNISNSKSNYIKNLSAVLKETNTNYLSDILPGDWVVAWIVNNKEDFQSLMVRLNSSDKTTNYFNDGLKFLGRAHSIRKNIAVDRGTGKKIIRINFQAVGFNELSCQVFYDPALSATNDKRIPAWLTKIGLDVPKLFGISKDGKNNITNIMTAVLDIILGSGVSKTINPGIDLVNKGKSSAKKSGKKRGRDGIVPPSGTPIVAAAGGGEHPEAPFAYLVPQQIGDILGKSSDDKSKGSGFLGYADLLEFWGGIQHYKDKSQDSVGVFIPELDTGKSTSNRKFTKDELLGSFLDLPSFTNRPVWQYLEQYKNPTINEMFTCLGTNEEGKIVPKIIVRQIPFTTDAFSNRPGEGILSVTRFLDLPRWIVPPSIVSSIDIGRSDATRYNLIHIYAKSDQFAKQLSISQQMANNFPIRDDLDIQRSGVRTYMTTVNCHLTENKGKAPSAWMSLVGDWSIGSQYTLNGTMQCFGIQSPICEGDNIQFDGIVYHIESVVHSCGISENGMKSFNTTLTLTNGMADSNEERPLFPSYPGFQRYQSPILGEIKTLESQRSSNNDTELDAELNDRIFESQVKAAKDSEIGGQKTDPTSNTAHNPGLTSVRGK